MLARFSTSSRPPSLQRPLRWGRELSLRWPRMHVPPRPPRERPFSMPPLRHWSCSQTAGRVPRPLSRGGRERRNGLKFCMRTSHATILDSAPQQIATARGRAISAPGSAPVRLGARLRRRSTAHMAAQQRRPTARLWRWMRLLSRRAQSTLPMVPPGAPASSPARTSLPDASAKDDATQRCVVVSRECVADCVAFI